MLVNWAGIFIEVVFQGVIFYLYGMQDVEDMFQAVIFHLYARMVVHKKSILKQGFVWFSAVSATS